MRATHVSNIERDRARRAKTSRYVRTKLQPKATCVLLVCQCASTSVWVCMCLWREEERQRERALQGGSEQPYEPLYLKPILKSISSSLRTMYKSGVGMRSGGGARVVDLGMQRSTRRFLGMLLCRAGFALQEGVGEFRQSSHRQRNMKKLHVSVHFPTYFIFLQRRCSSYFWKHPFANKLLIICLHNMPHFYSVQEQSFPSHAHFSSSARALHTHVICTSSDVFVTLIAVLCVFVQKQSHRLHRLRVILKQTWRVHPSLAVLS